MTLDHDTSALATQYCVTAGVPCSNSNVIIASYSSSYLYGLKLNSIIDTIYWVIKFSATEGDRTQAVVNRDENKVYFVNDLSSSSTPTYVTKVHNENGTVIWSKYYNLGVTYGYLIALIYNQQLIVMDNGNEMLYINIEDGTPGRRFTLSSNYTHLTTRFATITGNFIYGCSDFFRGARRNAVFWKAYLPYLNDIKGDPFTISNSTTPTSVQDNPTVSYCLNFEFQR